MTLHNCYATLLLPFVTRISKISDYSFIPTSRWDSSIRLKCCKFVLDAYESVSVCRSYMKPRRSFPANPQLIPVLYETWIAARELTSTTAPFFNNTLFHLRNQLPQIQSWEEKLSNPRSLRARILNCRHILSDHGFRTSTRTGLQCSTVGGSMRARIY
jgi:hypothetical protein